MKIYATTVPDSEFLPFVGKDLWVKVVSDYDFDFSAFRAGVPFWLKVHSMEYCPAQYGLPAGYRGLGYTLPDSIVDWNMEYDEEPDPELADTINRLRNNTREGLIYRSFDFSDGSITLVRPIEVLTTDEIFGIGW